MPKKHDEQYFDTEPLNEQTVLQTSYLKKICATYCSGSETIVPKRKLYITDGISLFIQRVGTNLTHPVKFLKLKYPGKTATFWHITELPRSHECTICIIAYDHVHRDYNTRDGIVMQWKKRNVAIGVCGGGDSGLGCSGCRAKRRMVELLPP